MSDDLPKLLELARGGQPDPFYRLVEALRLKSNDDHGLLLDYLAAGDALKRRAGLSAAGGSADPLVLAAVIRLADDPDPVVRKNLAYAITEFPHWPLAHLVPNLLGDVESFVRQLAVWTAKGRGLLDPLIARLAIEEMPFIRQDIANALAECAPAQALPALASQLAKDFDQGVQQSCAFGADKHLGALRGSYPAGAARPNPSELAEIRRRVATFTFATYPNLTKWLDGQLAAHVDVDQLAGFGTVLTREAEAGQLPHAFGMDKQIAAVLGMLQGAPPRAVVLLGESGAGKTALVQEITHRLLHDPSGPAYVLRLAPQEFLVNTKFIGEWETRVRNIVSAVKPPRRVVVYIPNVEELAYMGTWEKSEASVASALQPFIERGDITILGESSVESFRKGLGANRSLRRLFQTMEIPAADATQTRTILHAVADDAGVEISEAVLDRLGELADYASAGTVAPGRSVGLLRRVLSQTAGRRGPITEKDILATLSAVTGIPTKLLDDAEALDRADVRAFFEARVMGQPEAVDAMIDLVTLVKAGLTDPQKPLGVFLFVGPTGVGKTELARTLAEHLFGDPGRLIRLDMSEFATYEAFERLIGSGYRAAEPGLLTAAVRERPFAVVLFDEIEKAHANIYNLCLQIFDAGRLTDTQGRTADFRRTIIIMTSNVGSSLANEAPVGFSRKAAAAPDRDLILREVGRWFRPEFLNRLDRIVTFRPLAVETAEKIARREVARVLERGGIARRRLAVDVDPAVLPLLLREGYSPAFGARPLKRTIERLVLLPAARAIAEGKAPPGSLLRLVAKQNRVDIEVEPPEAPEAPQPPAPRAVPVTQRAEQLLERCRAVTEQAAPLAARKSTLLEQSHAADFWEDRAASRQVMDEVYRLDGILSNLHELDKKLHGEADLIQRHRRSDRDLGRINQHFDGLESQLQHLAFLVGCQNAEALGDAVTVVRRAGRQGHSLDGVVQLARMYANLAERRGMEVQVLDDRHGGEPPEDTVALFISGPGAFALLAGEAGLHQLSRGRKQQGPLDRETVQVEVWPAPTGTDSIVPDDVQTEVRSIKGQKGRLCKRLTQDVRLFHAPSLTAVRLQCDGSKQEALDRAKLILRVRLDAHQSTEPPRVVRRYRLGPTTLVRDQRTGRRTGRLDEVLAGHLDSFLIAPARGPAGDSSSIRDSG